MLIDVQLNENVDEIKGIKNYIATIESGIDNIIERTKKKDPIYDGMREEWQQMNSLKKKIQIQVFG